MGTISSLPYSPVEGNANSFVIDDWQVYMGTENVSILLFIILKGTNKEVSIFAYNLSEKSRHDQDRGLNCLENLKTLRHPSILRYVDSFVDKEKIIIVTERVFQFRFHDFLSADTDIQNLIAVGLYQICVSIYYLYY